MRTQLETIRSIRCAGIRRAAFVDDHRPFPLEGQAAHMELDAQGVVIDPFEEARAELPVNLDCRPDDCLPHVLRLKGSVSSLVEE
jgi:hypothetical protein